MLHCICEIFKDKTIALTYLDGILGATEAIPQLSTDVLRKKSMKQMVPNATFIVFYRPNTKMEEVAKDIVDEVKSAYIEITKMVSNFTQGKDKK